MKTLKVLALLGIGLALSACSGIDIPTRNASYVDLPGLAPAPAGMASRQAALAAPEAAALSPVRVSSVVVHVPQHLQVSEANRYMPGGDIVWRGDAPGDRHAQVKAIFETAMQRGTAPLNGAQTVNIEIEVIRFHALTEKARYTTGGVHAIEFMLAIKDARTGELVVPVREVRADLEAFGGEKAIEADRAGQTQKVRITDHLSRVIQHELTQPGGHKNAKLGLFQRLNHSL
jgi:hypothetical protein